MSRPLPREAYAGLRALGMEIDRLDQVAADRFGLNRTDMRVLDILGSTGPLTPTVLADLLGFTTGGVTTVLDRLENAGYVSRRNDPHDRRRQIVETTPATTEREREVFHDLIDATTQFLDSYTDEQLGVINDFLTRMREITASHAETLAREPRLRQSPARPGVRTRRPSS
jgi:DNA-binding MarR family transcriptional regulator